MKIPCLCALLCYFSSQFELLLWIFTDDILKKSKDLFNQSEWKIVASYADKSMNKLLGTRSVGSMWDFQPALPSKPKMHHCFSAFLSFFCRELDLAVAVVAVVDLVLHLHSEQNFRSLLIAWRINLAEIIFSVPCLFFIFYPLFIPINHFIDSNNKEKELLLD